MKWKDWPSWKKIGLILGILGIYLLVYVIIYISDLPNRSMYLLSFFNIYILTTILILFLILFIYFIISFIFNSNWYMWIKGGIMSIIIYFLLFNFIFWLIVAVSHGIMPEMAWFPFYLITFPGNIFYYLAYGKSLVGSNGEITSGILESVTILFINFVFYFIIGALIGWLIGKIKSKKEENKK